MLRSRWSSEARSRRIYYEYEDYDSLFSTPDELLRVPEQMDPDISRRLAYQKVFGTTQGQVEWEASFLPSEFWLRSLA